jgi:elongation factor Ts
MANITAAMVKELREKTGAGMMDCKTALNETGGDLEAAIDWLRKKGLSKAAKKAGRVAAEGLVAVESAGHQATILEVNSETDFVARNESFGQLARDIALHIASADPIGVTPEDVPAEMLDRERRIAEEQVAAEGKPENIRAKIVEGKLKKFVAERTLLEQPFVRNDKITVGELIKEASGKLGEAITVRRFARFQIGAA